MTIDAHIHITADGSWYNTGLDASEETALRQMDAAGIEHAVIIPMTGQEQRDFCLMTATHRSDRFTTGFTVSDTTDTEYAALLSLLKQENAKFIKVHPRITGIAPLDPKLTPFLHLAAQHNIPVIFDTYIRGAKLPLQQLTPHRYDELARNHPALKIILAHAGAHRLFDALSVAQSHPNIHLDISHIVEYYSGTSIEKDIAFIMRKMDQKVIYGSDFPEYPIDKYLSKTRSVAGSYNDICEEGIFGKNWQLLTNGKA